MTEEELKDYRGMLEKLKEVRRANETPEQAMANYVKFTKDASTSGMSNTLKMMQGVIDEELKHIPDWPEPQNELRMIYQTRRMHSLGKKVESKQTAKDVLEACIENLKANYPAFQFKYDEEFFNRCGSLHGNGSHRL
jgi:hypothetical protein